VLARSILTRVAIPAPTARLVPLSSCRAGIGRRQNGRRLFAKQMLVDRVGRRVAWPGQYETVSGWLESRKEDEIVSHDRRPDIGFEVAEPTPCAAPQTVGAIQA